MAAAGVIGRRMCVTVTSSLPLMPAHTHHVQHGKKQAFKHLGVTCYVSWHFVTFQFKLTSSPLGVLWPHSSPQRSWQRANGSAGGRCADQEGHPSDGCLSSAVDGLCFLSQRVNMLLSVGMHACLTWFVCIVCSWWTGSAQQWEHRSLVCF